MVTSPQCWLVAPITALSRPLCHFPAKCRLTVKARIIFLPSRLADHAGIKDRAIFVGRGTRFQIWAPERACKTAVERGHSPPSKFIWWRDLMIGMGPVSSHEPVLINEMVRALKPRDGAEYVDGTFGIV